MPATITSVEVYGFNGDPCTQSGKDRKVAKSSFDGSQCRANQRYNRLKANSLRIDGTDLDLVNEIRLSSSEDYRFAVIEKCTADDNKVLYVWFLYWPPSEIETAAPTLGDLTVTIDTSSPVDDDQETDSSVEFEV